MSSIMTRAMRLVQPGIALSGVMLLALWLAPASASAQKPPKGFYLDTCQDPGMSTSYLGAPMLVATCMNYYKQYQPATLEAPESCPTVDTPQGKIPQIYNENGALRCIFKPGKNDPSGHLNWDLIGKTSWKDEKHGIQITYWTIDQPDVAHPFMQYPEITYEPGDTLWMAGGGCAQSGGSGNTWKQYVNPSGDSSGPPNGEYFGLVLLPGTDAPKFDPPNPPPSLSVLAYRNWTVYRNPMDPPDQKLSLTLGYVDDGFPNQTGAYGDNGYYSHDDGDDGQCSGSEPGSYTHGPAWFQLIVEHPLDPGAAHYSSGSRPFDIVFDQIDANGLPLTPMWDWQLHTPPADKQTANERQFGAPDFDKRCGGAFSTPSQYSAGNVAGDVGSAAAGAALGSVAGPVGTIIGAIGGWLFGSDVVADTSTKMDLGKLEESCTSQPVEVDQFSATSTWGSAVLGVGPICPADPIRGHLNYQPVTYTGSLRFSDWSGVFPEDSDINMSLVAGTADDNGKQDLKLLTASTAGTVGQFVPQPVKGSSKLEHPSGYQNSEVYPDGGLLIEYDAEETLKRYFIGQPNGSFWHDYAALSLAAGPSGALDDADRTHYTTQIEAVNNFMGEPKPDNDDPKFFLNSVVTGIMGIDGVHSGGMSELHPVFVMAVHRLDKDETTPKGKKEHWAFFLRNQGDEGNCSDQTHSWEPEEFGTRDYYIQFPWPWEADKPPYDKVTVDAKGYPWVNGSSMGKSKATPGVGTFLHFLSPPYPAEQDVPFFGYDGEVTLEYTLATDKKSEKRLALAEPLANPTSSAEGKDEDKKDLGKEDKEMNDAEDFPWRQIVALSKDPAVTAHLKKHFTQTADLKESIKGLPGETQQGDVEYVAPKTVARDAKLPYRTNRSNNAAKQRQIDEIMHQAGHGKKTFQAVDAQHVFYLGVDGDLHFKEGPFTPADSGASGKVVDRDVLGFAAISPAAVLAVGKEGHLYSESAPFNLAADGACKTGYVWRGAYDNDRVCVSPKDKEEAQADNADGAGLVNRDSHFEPGSCVQGFVWRQANEKDHVCVRPDVRSHTAQENRSGPSRIAPSTPKVLLGKPVTKAEPVSTDVVDLLDANGRLYSITLPFNAANKPTLVAERVRDFQVIDKTQTLVLNSDDRLQIYNGSSATGKTVSNVWSFHQASDGSLFVIDGSDALWSEESTARQLDTDVRKVQAMDASTVFVLKNDQMLSLLTAAQTASPIKVPVADNIREFQALDAQTVVLLDAEGKLWLMKGPFHSMAVSKLLIAESVR